MATLNTRGIPKKVLLGKEPRLLSVARLYRARMIQELFRLANEAFITRSEGELDPYMGTWTQLAARTIAQKQALIDKGKIKKTYGKLSPEQRKEAQHLIKSGFTKSAATEMAGSDPKASLIGIRTGRLVASTVPGTVTNNRYYGTKDQSWYMDEKEIRIALLVEYADDFDVGNTPAKHPIPRPIFPPEGYWDDWLTTAHEACIEEVVAYCKLKVIELKSKTGTNSNESVKYTASNRQRKVKRGSKKQKAVKGKRK